MHDEEHVRVNRAGWDKAADEYQQIHEKQIAGQALTGDIAWGVGHPRVQAQCAR